MFFRLCLKGDFEVGGIKVVGCEVNDMFCFGIVVGCLVVFWDVFFWRYDIGVVVVCCKLLLLGYGERL